MRLALAFAFKKTLPVMVGYLFIGIAYGVLLEEAGYGLGWALLTGLVIYAGSMQFVLVSFLASGTGLFAAAIMTLLINCRHIFYGLTFIDRFKSMGKAAPYMVSAMTDETYSLLCSCTYPEGADENKCSLLIAAFNHAYWIAGSAIGSVAGSLIAFDLTGVDFAMTALFIVILVGQWKGAGSHIPACAGLVSSAVFLALLGPDRFLPPSLAAAAAVLMFFRPLIADKRKGEAE